MANHLLFADDTLIFCKDSKEQMAFLGGILTWLSFIEPPNQSGQKLNLSDRKGDDGDSLALKLGSQPGSLPTEYLGLSLGAKHNSATIWNKLEERYRKRLANWKRQYTSEGGPLTLIKSTGSKIFPLIFCPCSIFQGS